MANYNHKIIRAAKLNEYNKALAEADDDNKQIIEEPRYQLLTPKAGN